MCIIFLHFCDKPGPNGFQLIIASNRDEFYFRPTARAKCWDKNPDIIAGMDMEQGKEGGTWLGINKNGKFAAITNYRQASKFIDPDAQGRGHLVADFLTGETSVTDYLECISSVGDKYNGFNLLVGDLQEDSKSAVGWYCNVENKEVRRLTPGTYALSNRVLDCSWPKMVYGKERFTEILEEALPKQELVDELLLLLNNRQRHFPNEDDECYIGPQDDGADLKMINSCRAIFVKCKEAQFGTRTNTVILVDSVGHVTYVERTMQDDATDPDEADWLLNTLEFDITNTDRDGERNQRTKTNSVKQDQSSSCRSGSEKEAQMTGRENNDKQEVIEPIHVTSGQPKQQQSRKRPLKERSVALELAKKVTISDKDTQLH